MNEHGDPNVPRNNSALSQSQRPHSGIFNIMWNKVAEILEMRTFTDWSEDDIDIRSDIEITENHFGNDESASSGREPLSTSTSSSLSKTESSSTSQERSKVSRSTSYANSTTSSQSSSTSAYYSYESSTISSNSSFSSFREEDFDFVDTLTFQDYDAEYEREFNVNELGEGHSFVPTRLFHVVTWCDKCGDIIWGFHKQCLRCMHCKYTCHYKCYQNGVRLDCSEYNQSKGDGHDVSPDFTLISLKDSAFTSLPRAELLKRTAEYNAEIGKKVMKVEPDAGTHFFGPLTVFFNLGRPVSMRAGSAIPTFCNSLKRYDHSVDVSKRRTSFFFPKATVESLHITSDTTAQEVIHCLLERYRLIDNPRKFALFERTEKTDGEILMRKLEDDDPPLLNVLFWGPNNTEKSMEIRENETGMIQWEAFSLPELDNFLRILGKEEEEYIEQVRKKFVSYEKVLRDALKESGKSKATDHHVNGEQEERTQLIK